MIYLISGDMDGAGKSTLANKLSTNVMSLANLLRFELHKKYPMFDWYDRSQSFKDGTLIAGKTARTHMIEQGTRMREMDENHYVRALCEQIKFRRASLTGFATIAVDDLRYVNEKLYFLSKFPKDSICHLHIVTPTIDVSNPETKLLSATADYRVER